jgi:hypothetical protein
MSDLQDLIHKTSMDCIEKGQAMERERIIELLEENAQGDYKQVMLTPKLIAQLKGEKNGERKE